MKICISVFNFLAMMGMLDMFSNSFSYVRN